MVRKGLSGSTGLRNKKDPAWKYSTKVEGDTTKGYVYLLCNFCNKVIKGGVKRMKDHLGGTHKNIVPCGKAPPEVKQEMIEYLQKGVLAKHKAQKAFDDMVESGCYFGTGTNPSSEGIDSSTPTRGNRGPMDRFVINVDEEEGDTGVKTTSLPANAKEARNRVCLDIGRFFFENGIAFNVANSPSFANMCNSLGNYGRGFKRPTSYELSTWILKEEIKTTSEIVNNLRRTWSHTGVTIMSDGWKDVRGRSLINFLVNNPQGTVFLKSIDASDAVKDSNLLFKLLDEVVEEVGEDLVVQVVTDNAAAYKLAGTKLMEKRKHLYWTPCAAHCLDLMLEKLGELPQHKNALRKAKKITTFIYNHVCVLALMRSFSKRELIRPAATRFATAYLTLQSILQSKQPLESMFTSEQWATSAWATKTEGKEVKKIILRDSTFWSSVSYAIKTTKPLVGVLRLVDSEKEPAMGFIYGAMDKAKEEIARNLGGEEASYKEIWNIIDEKWDFQLHRPLHAAAYFLNPQFQYDPSFSIHPEIKAGLFICMDKLIVDRAERDLADLQISHFKFQKGFFGRPQAISSIKNRTPVEWWTHFGDETPELTRFAVRILGLTCSSSGCERNWSTFNQIHTKRRNRLSAKKLDQLVYVMYNKKLKDRHLKHKGLKEDEDPLILENVSSDDEWMVDKENASRLSNEDDDHDIDDVEIEGSSARSSRQKEKKSTKSNKNDKGKALMLVDEDEEWEDFESDEEDDRVISSDDED